MQAVLLSGCARQTPNVLAARDLAVLRFFKGFSRNVGFDKVGAGTRVVQLSCSICLSIHKCRNSAMTGHHAPSIDEVPFRQICGYPYRWLHSGRTSAGRRRRTGERITALRRNSTETPRLAPRACGVPFAFHSSERVSRRPRLFGPRVRRDRCGSVSRAPLGRDAGRSGVT